MGTGKHSLWRWALMSQTAFGWNVKSSYCSLGLMSTEGCFQGTPYLPGSVEVTALGMEKALCFRASLPFFFIVFWQAGEPDSSSKNSPTDRSSPQSLPPTEHHKHKCRIRSAQYRETTTKAQPRDPYFSSHWRFNYLLKMVEWGCVLSILLHSGGYSQAWDFFFCLCFE